MTKNQIEISGTAWIGSEKMTSFMKFADLCPEYKTIGSRINLGYRLEYDGPNKTINELKDLFEYGIQIAKQEFGTRLIFCHIEKITQHELSVKNQSVLPSWNPEISVVSNGTHFSLLVDIVKTLCPNIEIEEGEVRRIKSLKYKTPI